MSAVECEGGTAVLERPKRPARAAKAGGGGGNATAGHCRAVVNPDLGRAYASAAAAVKQVRKAEGVQLSVKLIWRAIRTGRPYAGRYWDWRYPIGWDELAMWFRLAEAGLVDWESLGK